MRSILKGLSSITLAILLVVSAFGGQAVVPASADGPPAFLWHQFYGSVTVNGSSPTSGTVSLYLDGTLSTTSAIDSQGRYGYSPLCGVTANPGQVATFTITTSGTYAASQSYTMAATDETVRLNLTTATTALSVASSTASGVTSTTATLNGILSDMGGFNPVTVYFQYGPSYGLSTATQSKTATGTFNASLTGLTPSTTYIFRAVAQSGSTIVYATGLTFTTSAPALSVTTIDASGIAATIATLNANLNDMGGVSPVSVYFQYGTTGGYGYTTAAQSKTSTGSFTAALTSLSSGTPYYFRAVAVGSSTVYGDGKTFTTSSTGLATTTGSAVSISCNSAILNGTLSSLGGASSANVYFQYGTSSSALTNTTTSQSRAYTGDFAATLSGLSASTPYYFKAVASAGSTTVSGTTVSFTTPSCSGGGTAPHQFYGKVYSNGIATSGASVAAFVNGVAAETTTSDSSGRYGWTTMYTVSGGPGTVTFKVNGTLVPQTATWVVGGVTNLDLYLAQATLAVATNSATYAGTASATLSGSIAGWSTSDISATTSFVWGTTAGGPYSNTITASPSSFTGTGSFTGTLAGLTTGLTYYIKAKAIGTSSGEKLGEQLTYVHTPGGTLTVTTTSATYAGADSATLSGSITAWNSSDISAATSFVWGIANGGPYSNTVTASPSSFNTTGTFTGTMYGLSSGQTYYIKARAIGSSSGEKLGSQIIYVHSPGGSLTVTTNGATYVGAGSATLSGSITAWSSSDTSAATSFIWGTTDGGPYSNTVTASPSSFGGTGSFTGTLSGLTTGLTYYIKARAVGTSSGEKLGSQITYIHTSGICGSDPVGCTVGRPYTMVLPFWVYASRYTATTTATINHINVISYGTGNIKVAIYSDSFNSVGTLIAGSTGEGAVIAGLNSIPLDSPISITSGTTYWLAEWSDAPVFAFTAESGAYANSNVAYTSISFPTTAISWRYPAPGNFRGLISGSN